jgi:hypothetical protein
VYKFESIQKLKTNVISIVDPDVQKLVFCFIVAGKMGQAWESINLPRTERNAKLRYALSDYRFDEVRVFYTDRLRSIVPHRIAFLCYRTPTQH